ncbi:hypothetical protein [Flagellimonas baculiformis]|uniref:hypothetical protein n=1 Tax=Flagellimonas baculiformis TaxID=3067310 RepID=UPI00296E9338|nr:hypothetical protein [Muricauda sp. D6]
MQLLIQTFANHSCKIDLERYPKKTTKLKVIHPVKMNTNSDCCSRMGHGLKIKNTRAIKQMQFWIMMANIDKAL